MYREIDGYSEKESSLGPCVHFLCALEVLASSMKGTNGT